MYFRTVFGVWEYYVFGEWLGVCRATRSTCSPHVVGCIWSGFATAYLLFPRGWVKMDIIPEAESPGTGKHSMDMCAS